VLGRAEGPSLLISADPKASSHLSRARWHGREARKKAKRTLGTGPISQITQSKTATSSDHRATTTTTKVLRVALRHASAKACAAAAAFESKRSSSANPRHVTQLTSDALQHWKPGENAAGLPVGSALVELDTARPGNTMDAAIPPCVFMNR
jgi:hypothetical protein